MPLIPLQNPAQSFHKSAVLQPWSVEPLTEKSGCILMQLYAALSALWDIACYTEYQKCMPYLCAASALAGCQRIRATRRQECGDVQAVKILTQFYSIRLHSCLGPSQSQCQGNISPPMFTVDSHSPALSLGCSQKEPMAGFEPALSPTSIQACLSFPRHVQEVTHQETRLKNSWKLLLAARNVLQHALFWLSFAGPLKVNTLSCIIIRKANPREHASIWALVLAGWKKNLSKTKSTEDLRFVPIL